MITLKQVLDDCYHMGRIEIDYIDWTIDPNYENDDNGQRLISCCKMVLAQLYSQFKQDDQLQLPEDINDTVVLPSIEKDGEIIPLVTLETYYFGVLAEYFFQSQDYLSFQMWNQRYERAQEQIRLAHGYQLPTRRWI